MTTITNARQDCLVLPYVAETEAKAEMFADALELIFLWDIKVEVIQDGGEWGVAVVDGADLIDDSLEDKRIVSAAILLNSFDLADNTGGIRSLEDHKQVSMDDIPAEQKALTHRARRVFRIEDKLDRILSHFERDNGLGDKLDRMYYVLIEEAAEAEVSDKDRRLAHADA
jgi:hypothetical protein